MRYLLLLLAIPLLLCAALARQKDRPQLPYAELSGKAEGFRFIRQWRSYYWREDFTFTLKTDDGKSVRIISREPTPWTNLRLGTTFTGLKVDWEKNPRVKVIGVRGIDRQPADFHDLKLDEKNTVTALIVRVEVEKGKTKDYFVNNWFHPWSKDADPKVVANYANDDPNYTIYGYVNSQPAPFDRASQGIFDKHKDDYNGHIYHARVVKTDKGGHELKLIHLMGRHKKSLEYRVFHGDPKTMIKLDQKAPAKDRSKEEKQTKQSKTRFSDVSTNSGLKIVKDSKPHAVAVADINGDDKPDILLATFDAPHIQFFLNQGGLKFVDVTKGSGLESFKGTGSGIAVADYDGDGKPDVYITSVRKGESRLFRNLGGGKFDDVSSKSGTLLSAAARSCAWSDIDGDGKVDLFVCCPDSSCRIFRNNGDGTFTDIAEKAGVALKGRHTLGCAFGDIDGDGRDDLFVTCYKSQSSALFRNLGKGKFAEITTKAGLDRKASAVGCVFADVFNRGVLDLYVTTDSWLSGANYTEKQLLDQKHTVEPNVLYRGDGKGKFTAVDEATLALKTLGHDAAIEDLDHDGLMEIYCTVDAESGNKWATSKGGDRIWTRADGKVWSEVSKSWGVNHQANCVCVGAADLDGDGDLDLVLVNFYSEIVLLRNNSDDKNWLRVRAVGAGANTSGIGARVRLLDATGKTLLGTRHIQSGMGYCRCSPLEAHFGLGRKPAEAYTVEMTFPGGKKVVKAGVKRAEVVVLKEGS